MKIGIVVLATNCYFVMGMRFIHRFMHFYKGNNTIQFYLFSDTDPSDYTSYNNIKYIQQTHSHWAEATNSKFLNIISLEQEDCDYLFYFDADTNIHKEFDDEWFVGDTVTGEHYSNRHCMKDVKAFDRNPKSKAYVPQDTDLPQMYYYGAFFGGKKDTIINVCKTLREWQLTDKKIPYEPIWNDESYLNCYFHFNKPDKVIYSENFKFLMSDKGGIKNSRDTSINTDDIKEKIKQNKDRLWNIVNGDFNLC